MDLYLLITALLGSLIGIFVGVSPAIGGSFTMITFFPMLLTLGPLHAIVFYITFRISSQYSGSVSALLFGLLGEITSYPALKERENLQSYQSLYNGIMHTALGSLVGSFVALLFCFYAITYLSSVIYIMRSEILLLILSTAIIILMLWPGNKIYQNILLLITGVFVGAIGFDPITAQDFMTFGNQYLSSGIPLMPVLIGFVAVPVFINIFSSFDTVYFKNDNLNTHHCWTTQKFSWAAALRGSVVGSVMGLIPAIGSAMSSNFAWNIERYFSKTVSEHDSLKRLTSAETANNSAVITVMLPLFMFGIAIIPSELILFHVISAQGWSYIDMTSVDYLSISLTVLLSAAIGFLICSHWVHHLITVIKQHGKLLTSLTLAATILSVMYIGYTQYSAAYYGVLIVLFSTVGLLLRKFEFTPLVMGFMISDQLLRLVVTVTQMYF